MKGGGAAVSIDRAKRTAILTEIEAKWTAEVEAGCGPDLAAQIRALFAQHRL